MGSCPECGHELTSLEVTTSRCAQCGADLTKRSFASDHDAGETSGTVQLSDGSADPKESFDSTVAVQQPGTDSSSPASSTDRNVGSDTAVVDGSDNDRTLAPNDLDSGGSDSGTVHPGQVDPGQVDPGQTVAINPRSNNSDESPDLGATVQLSETDTSTPDDTGASTDLGKTISIDGSARQPEADFGATIVEGDLFDGAKDSDTHEPIGGSHDQTLVTTPGATPSDGDLGKTLSLRDFSEEDFEVWGQGVTAYLGGESAEPGSKNEKRTANVSGLKGGRSDTIYSGKTSVAIRGVTGLSGQVVDEPASTPDYSIDGRLGAGNMGVVYLARQRSMNREVALKTIKPEGRKQRDQLDNLASEAIVTGNLNHPNIVPVYDLGRDDDGNLFYSMKRVDGVTWDDVLAEKTLDENLDIFMRVCDGIAFGHSRGVVHRDLKPENVLIAAFGEVLVMDWGLAYATDEFPKLDSIVRNVTMGGSPAYMSPEAAHNFLVMGGWKQGDTKPINASIDIYLLGSILFEMISGHPPHAGKDLMACVVAASENKIRDAGPDAPEGLLEIAHKAMAADAADRYQNVEELQDAVRQYERNAESITLTLRGNQQLEAGNLGRAVASFEDAVALWDENEEARNKYAIAQRRLERRRYTTAALTAALVLVTVGGFGGVTYQWSEAVVAKQEADQQREIAEVERREAEVAEKKAIAEEQLARAAEREANLARQQAQRAAEEEKKARVAAVRAEGEARRAAAEEAIAKRKAEEERQKAEVAKREQEFLNYVARIKLANQRIEENDLREALRLLNELAAGSPQHCGFEWQHLMYLCSQGSDRLELASPVLAVDVSGDESLTVFGTADGAVELWQGKEFRVADAQPIAVRRPEGLLSVDAVAASSDGLLYAAAGASPSGSLSPIFIYARGEERSPLKLELTDSRKIQTLRFLANDSQLLSAGDDGIARIWDVETGELLAATKPQSAKWTATDAVMTSDENYLCVAGLDGTVAIFGKSGAGSSLELELQGAFEGHRRLVRSADNRQYLEGEVTCLSSLSDGRIASGDAAGQVFIWDPAKVRRADRLDQTSAIDIVKRLATGGEVGDVADPSVYRFQAHDSEVTGLSTTTDDDGRTLIASGGADTLVRVYLLEGDPNAIDATQRVLLSNYRGHTDVVTSCRFDPSNPSVLVSCGADGRVVRWNLAAGGEVRNLPAELTGHSGAVLSAKFSQSGDEIVTTGRDEVVTVVDLADPDKRREFSEGHDRYAGLTAVVPTPDGEYLVTTGYDGVTQVWSVVERTQRARLAGLPREGREGSEGFDAFTPLRPVVSPDSRWLVTDSDADAGDHRLAFWSLADVVDPKTSPRPIAIISCENEPTAAAFSGDGERLYVGDSEGRCYVWSRKTEDLKSFAVHSGRSPRVTVIREVPDTGKVLSAAEDYTVVRWSGSDGQPDSGWSLKHPGWVEELEVTPDGKFAVTTSGPRNAANELRLWNLETKQEVWNIGLKQQQISSVSMRPDGTQLLVTIVPTTAGSGGGAVHLLNTEDFKEVRFDPETGQPIMVGENRETVPFLNSDLLGDRVFAAAFGADGRTVFTAGLRGVAVWDVATRSREHGAFRNPGEAIAAAFTPDGKRIVIGTLNGSVLLLDATTPMLNATFSAQPPRATGRIDAIAVAPASANEEDESYRFATAVKGAVALRTVSRSRPSRLISQSMSQSDPLSDRRITALAFSNDGTLLFGGDDSGKLLAWEVADDRIQSIKLSAHPVLFRHQGPIHDLAFDSTNRLAASNDAAATNPAEGDYVFATASADDSAAVWVARRSGESLSVVPISVARGHGAPVTSIAFAERYDRLFTAGDDGTVRLWDWDRDGLSNWEVHGADNDQARSKPQGATELLVLERHTDAVTSVDFAARQSLLLSAGEDGRTILWPGVAPPTAKSAESAPAADGINP
ncbi:protein kinase domain-containing protein [Stratiformator vulcanicus]|uniref:Serine/threonine-protein kinase PknD n=1 Tax=Stratiformator vulcanicus TaxID=2527980 RepID=A0A517QYL3_9PLAN|nr:protein kinase [Stratiformator vulcanicus]QDT36732.1 Serine/threonine-protein kinase PknD [Stratiformator vulcanicus]